MGLSFVMSIEINLYYCYKYAGFSRTMKNIVYVFDYGR